MVPGLRDSGLGRALRALMPMSDALCHLIGLGQGYEISHVRCQNFLEGNKTLLARLKTQGSSNLQLGGQVSVAIGLEGCKVHRSGGGKEMTAANVGNRAQVQPPM